MRFLSRLWPRLAPGGILAIHEPYFTTPIEQGKDNQLYYGFFAGVRSWIFTTDDLGGLIVTDVGVSFLIFFLWFKVVTAPLWNRRADRLTAGLRE